MRASFLLSFGSNIGSKQFKDAEILIHKKTMDFRPDILRLHGLSIYIGVLN
jgi:hypothetical protein